MRAETDDCFLLIHIFKRLVIDMRVEDKILVMLCKNELNAVKAIKEETFDWLYFIRQAVSHDVAGLLHPAFFEDYSIPRWVRNIIDSIYNNQKNLGNLMIEEFHNIVFEIQRENIDVIILKGMYLVPEIYKDAGLRPFGDLDILVKESDVKKVNQILRANGYTQGRYNAKNGTIEEFPESELKKYSDGLQHEAEYVAKRNLPQNNYETIFCKIDVHKRINTTSDYNTIPVKDLLCRSQCYDSTCGKRFKKLSREDMLIHLCYHLYWHTQSLQDIARRTDASLKLFVDIRTFIMAERPDINLVLEYAQKANMLMAVRFSLYFAQKLFGDILTNDEFEKLGEAIELETEGKVVRDRWITDADTEIVRFQYDYLSRLFDYFRFSKIDLMQISAKYEHEKTRPYFTQLREMAKES